jgi:hypothetical protein
VGLENINSKLFKGDLNSIVYLWRLGNKPIDEQMAAIAVVHERLQRGNRFFTVGSFANEHLSKIDCDMSLHKLTLLGYVLDWTYDNEQERYDIELASNYTSAYAEQQVTEYIRKFDPHFSLQGGGQGRHFASYRKQRDAGQDAGPQLMRGMLAWIDDNVTYARRAAIANIYNLCQGKLTGGVVPGDEAMRAYINAFFTLNSTDNARIEAVIQEAGNISAWMEPFFEVQPGTGRQLRPPSELAALSAMIDRYRESYHGNPGLEAANYAAKLAAGSGSDAGTLEQLLQTVPFLSAPAARHELVAAILPVLAQAPAPARELFAAQALAQDPTLAVEVHKTLQDAVSLEAIAQDASARLAALDVFGVES